jgi:membrane dipeptidase
VSERAVELLLQSDVIDLHVDTFIWTRLFGYDPGVWHGPGPLAARYLGQTDIPRLRAAGVTGAAWIITTNPCRQPRARLRALVDNYRALTTRLAAPGADTSVVATLSEYRAARAIGRQAAFVGVQGGNALSDEASSRVFPLDQLAFVTLMHLTDSNLGHSSSPYNLGSRAGLLPRGRELVGELEARHVLIDLAHASHQTFWDVVNTHDPTRPLLVTHTGFASVTPHWRNLDDRQAKAIAASGGIVGVLYHGPFLGGPPWGGHVRAVARHLAHGVRLLGAQHVCLGSDWDGMIATPVDMPTCLELPRLVQALLDEGLSDSDVTLLMGQSFLGCLEHSRP